MRGCEISDGVRNLIIQQWKDGQCIATIARNTSTKYSAAYGIIERFRKFGDTKIRPRCGRPKVITDRGSRIIMRMLRQQRRSKKCDLRNNAQIIMGRKMCKRTIRRCIHEHGYKNMRPRCKPYISKRNMRKRLAWAKIHRQWSINKWKKIVFSEECNVGNDCRCVNGVWRKEGEQWNTECMMATVKSGRFSVGVWGCVGWKGIGPLVVYNGRVNSVKYCDTIGNALPDMRKRFSASFILQDDNCHSHSSKFTMAWMARRKIQRMDWIAQSPDLNLIENVWSHLKRELGEMTPLPSTVAILEERIFDVWNDITVEYIHTLYESMSKRCELVIKNKGGSTKY